MGMDIGLQNGSIPPTLKVNWKEVFKVVNTHTEHSKFMFYTQASDETIKMK